VEIHLVGESLKFMVLGMIVVFTFLAALVQLIKIQAKIINRYFPEKELDSSAAGGRESVTDEGARTAAIIAAIIEFKRNKS